MQGTNLGNIYYTVDADTSGLISGSRRVDDATKNMNRSFEQTDRIASKLTATFTAVTAAISTNRVIAYADAWATVNNKLANSVKQNEALVDVTERVFNIAQNTRSSVDATASLYARLERATRDYGTSASDLIKLTETINRGFIVSGATAQEAENAVIQLSQGLASGALRGEEFNSVNEQGNRLIVALADSLGKTTGEMRNLAAQGKLTTDVVVKGLLKQAGTIENEYNKTLATFSQNAQKAEQNLVKFIGESNTVKEVVAGAGKAMIVASENIKTIAESATLFAAVLSARMIPALVESTLLTIKSVTAKAAATQADAAAAAAALRRAEAEKISALAVLQSAKLDMQAAAGSNAYAFAKDNLTRASAQAATAVGAYNAAAAASVAASSRAAAASTAMGLAMKAGGSALALIGGPAGAAFLAAAAIIYYYTTAETADEKTKRLSDEVDTLSESFKGLNAAQRQVAIAKLNTEMAEVRQKLIAANTALNNWNEQLKNGNPQAAIYVRKYSNEVDSLNGSLEKLSIEQQALFQSGLPQITNTTEDVKKSGVVISDNVKKITDSLEDERKQLTMTADGYEQYALRKQLAAAGASEAVIQANLKELRSQQELRKELELMDLVDADTDAQRKKKQERSVTVTAAVTDLASTPLEKLQSELQAQYDLIAEYETLETANHQTALDARAAADAAYLEKVKTLTADQGKSFGAMMEENGASLKSFQASAVGAFTAFATGAQTGEEALRNLAQSILTQMIGALVQMGIQALIGQATATAGAVASGATIATAMAPAAALTSLASFGANAAPAAAGITSTVGLAQGLAIAGGRLYGGYTAPNSMYKVTENGRAEMFSDGRDSFLMTGSRGGSVTPNGDLGGNSQPIINITTINNANNTDVSVQQSTRGNVTDVKFIVDTVASNISSGGKIRGAITQSTTAKNRVV